MMQKFLQVAVMVVLIFELPMQCTGYCTETLPFWCDDQSCIQRRDYCNGSAQCKNGRDEIKYNHTLHGGTRDMECRHSRNKEHTCLLPAAYRCDHEVDCVGGRDECGCESTFQCNSGDCALKIQFCDGRSECGDGSDELVYNRSTGGFQCQVTKKHVTLSCVLPEVHVCDGASECEWGTDECFCDFSAGKNNGRSVENVYSNDKCFRCLDGDLVISNNLVCDGFIHCKDLSDECLCLERNGKNENSTNLCSAVCSDESCGCPGKLKCIPGVKNGTKRNQEPICIDSSSICDDKYDCANGYDEDFCANDGKFLTCADRSKRVRKIVVCDGLNDCPDGSDEYRCHEDKFICSFHKNPVFWPHLIGWNDTENYPPINRTLIENSAFGYRYYWPFYTDACDGIPLCTDSEDECDSNLCPGALPGFCTDFKRNKCPNSESVLSGYEVCDGQPTCNDTAPHMSADEWGCPGRFYCKNKGSTRLPIHIPQENRCDGRAECDDQSDEMDCNNNTHFYCNDGGSTLFIPIEQKCDKREDCKEGSDECADCEISPFSSDKKLIKSRVLIVFLWMIGIVASVGNSFIIVHQIVNIHEIRDGPNPLALKNRVMILNLACADLLTGIYLIGLGIKDATVDKYCLMDQEWRSGATCAGLGAVAVIGTEASVLILLIMTTHRLYLVFNPFKVQKMSVVVASLIFAWALAIVLGTAPLASSARDYFLSCVWFRNHRYLGYTCKSQIESFTKNLILFEGSDKRFSKAVGSELSWNSMLAAQKVLNETHEPERYFGYYSAHSVCLPRLFPNRQNDLSWGYSLFLVLFNFFAFIFIFFGYIFIYRKSTAANVSVSKNDRAASLQRKVTRIVLTDFFCWMPICIMAFITVAGINVGDEAYAVTAIILLPINSAMNPFLYSSLLDVIWDHLKPVRDRINETALGRAMDDVWSSMGGNNRARGSLALRVIPPTARANRMSAPAPNEATYTPATSVTNVPNYPIGSDNGGELNSVSKAAQHPNEDGSSDGCNEECRM